MLLLSAALISAAVALPWVLAQLGRRFGSDDTPMGTVTKKKEYQGHDEALQKRTAARRLEAETMKRDGRQLECGNEASTWGQVRKRRA